MFIGNKDIDLHILNFLEDRDIINLSYVSKYLNIICNKENFWKNKLLQLCGNSIKKEIENLNILREYQVPEWKKLYFIMKTDPLEILHEAYNQLVSSTRVSSTRVSEEHDKEEKEIARHLCLLVYKSAAKIFPELVIEEEIISVICEPSDIKLIEMIFGSEDNKELISRLNLLEMFRMCCDRRENNIETKDQITLIKLLMKNGVIIDTTDILTVIEMDEEIEEEIVELIAEILNSNGENFENFTETREYIASYLHINHDIKISLIYD